MVVMQPVRGRPLEVGHPFSRTGVLPPNQATIAQLRRDSSDSRISVNSLNGGLGAVDVPQWAWWAAGGLALGAAAGFFLFKRKR